MKIKSLFQTGAFFKCELNVLVDMYLDGYEQGYIAEVLNRDVEDIAKQIRFKGLEAIREQILNEKTLKSRVKKHCGVAA